MRLCTLVLRLTFCTALVISLSALADIKINRRVTIKSNGTPVQSVESTVYIQGDRQRTDSTMPPEDGLVTINRCDHRQMLQINRRAKSYLVTSMDGYAKDDGPEVDTAADDKPASGTITFNEVLHDTGERKQFFGYTARHIRAQIASDPGTDSCLSNLKGAWDGWYIDLPVPTCGTDDEVTRQLRALAEKCGAKVHFRVTEEVRLGYPVLMNSALDARVKDIEIHQQLRQEVTRLEATELSSSLFEIPSGYHEVTSRGQLLAEAPRGEQAGSQTKLQATGAVLGPKRPEVLRIGIAQVTSDVGPMPLIKALQGKLITDLQSAGIEAVPLAANPDDRDAVEAEAKEKECDYYVLTDLVSLRQAGPARRSAAGKLPLGSTEAEVSVKAYLPEQMRPVLDGSNHYRGGDADSTLQSLMQIEAKSIATEISKVKP